MVTAVPFLMSVSVAVSSLNFWVPEMGVMVVAAAVVPSALI